MGRRLRWFREPRLTPLQAFILVFACFYAFYSYTTYLDEILAGALQAIAYVCLVLFGMFLGGSLVQYKKMAARIRRIARMKIGDAEKMDLIMDVLDELLYIVEREIEKKKKGGKK